MYRSNRLLGVFTLIGAFAWSGLADLNAATGAGLAELELRFESANKELGAQKAYESFQEEFTALRVSTREPKRASEPSCGC